MRYEIACIDCHRPIPLKDASVACPLCLFCAFVRKYGEPTAAERRILEDNSIITRYRERIRNGKAQD